MRRLGWSLLILLVGVAVLVAAIAVFWPVVSSWLPHPAFIKTWIRYLTVDLDIGRWGPVAILLLVGVIELVWALSLGRRSGMYERQWHHLERLHTREIEALNQEVALLKEERQALRSESELLEGLVLEEKARLWAQFEELQQAGGLSYGDLIVLDSPEPLPEVRGQWRQLISQLERIEVVSSVSVRRVQSAHQLQQHANELLRLGNACFYLGQYERALAHYGRASELAPHEPEALINHAVVNYALGRYKPALKDLEQALKVGEHAWAYLYRGLIRERLGDEKRALEDYARALRLDPSLTEGYHRRGLLYFKGREYERALQDQNQVLALDPNHAGAYTARGVARAALGDSQWALQDLDKGCALAPQRFEAFYQRGCVRHQLQMYDGALEDLGWAIELQPTFAPAFMARGDSYRATGEPRKAIEDYGQVIELQPKNATAHYARGVARVAVREYRRAIEDFDQALELDPGMAVALAERGAAYEKIGEYERAIRDLDRAVALEPNLAIAYYNRGLAYGSKGEYDRASRDLNKAVELDPSLGNQEQEMVGTGAP